MLHELLFALNGFPGSIFVEKDENFSVIKGLPFLHPSETIILDRLCSLGYNYKIFYKFVSSNRGFCQKGEMKELKKGLYLHALCNGMDKVLNDYRQDLLDIEQEILRDPHIALTFLQHKLEKYFSLFPVLRQLIEYITKNKVHGCYILDVVHKYSVSGIPIVTDSLKQILQSCHGVFFRQITAWLLYGMLLDPYNEFFIKKANKKNAPAVIEESGQGTELQSSSRLDTMDSYCIESKLLPDYFPTGIAPKILFTGVAVFAFGKPNEKDTGNVSSIYEGRETEFLQKLQDLQEKEFSAFDLENLVEEIRVLASKHLWKIIVEEGHLVSHLHHLKDFYLLGRGELFQEFIDSANPYLSGPVSVTTEHEVNRVFQAAAHCVLDDESVVEKFHVTVYNKRPGDDSSRLVLDGWTAIGIAYHVTWPLHALISPSILVKYNKIFRFLLSVRRAQVNLHHCWVLQMKYKDLGRDSTLAPMWQLRTHMSFLIDNLQYYLQVDVLESQFSQMIEKVNQMQDFEAIQHLHASFLSSVLGQTFILLKPLHQNLKEILDICHSFCSVVSDVSSHLKKSEATHIKSISDKFREKTHLLFQFLFSLRNHQASPHLAQLLLRIDYNRFFSRCGAQLGCGLQEKVEERPETIGQI